MKCEFCQREFINPSSLNKHQRTAKYCLRLRDVQPSKSATFICPDCGFVSTQKASHEKHLQSCKRTHRIFPTKDKFVQEITSLKELNDESTREIVELKKRNDEFVQEVAELRKRNEELVRQLAEKDMTLVEVLKNRNDELVKQLAEKERDIQLAELETSVRIYKEINDRDHRDIIGLADRPTTTNTTTNNFNCPPLTQEHFDDNAQFLSLDHIKKGFQGYAQYALDYPLKGRVKCTDYARRKVKFKNEDGEVVVDPEMKQVRTRLFNALRSRNQELTSEYIAELKQKADSGEWNRTDIQDMMLEAINLNGEVLEVGQGNNSESISEFVKWVCTGLMAED